MFYRRKIILALVQIFDGQLEKTRLQKLLFLFAQRKAKPEYEFVPYRYGCFSYSASADLTAMVTKGIISDEKAGFKKLDDVDYIKQLKTADSQLLRTVKANYGAMSTQALMKHTYLNYPFYAINSEVATTILNPEEQQKIADARPSGQRTVLFTIGYEGISLENYLIKLLKNDVKVLVDVRNNPLSMKYGFSKNQLKKYCESLGVKYVHFPQVGIQSDQRQELNNQSDYDNLFAQYREENLTQTLETQLEIFELLKKHKRIALTCFEANICQCHRKHLAEAIESLPSFSYELKHL